MGDLGMNTASLFRITPRGALVKAILVLLIGVPALAYAIPTLTMTTVDADAAEAGQDQGSFTVTRADDDNIGAALTFTVKYSGTANNFSDLTATGLTWNGSGYSGTIPANATSQLFTITPTLDNKIEGDETVIYTLNGSVDYMVGEPNSATMTIADDVAELTLELVDGDMSEAGQDPGSFTVFRTEQGKVADALGFSVKFSGTANNFNDFAESGLTYSGSNNYGGSIPAGARSRTFTITPSLDNDIEGEETVIYTLNGSSAHTVGTPNSVAMTLSDDVAELTLVLVDGDAAETSLDPGSFRVSRTEQGKLADALNFGVTVSGTASIFGTSKPASDFSTPGLTYISPNNYSGTIPANETSRLYTITPVMDNEIEDEETVIYILNPGSGFTLGDPSTVTITIADFVDIVFSDGFEEPDP
jgi:hypothetical protein